MDFFIYSNTVKQNGINVVRIWCSWCSIADFSSACTGSSPVIRCLCVYSFNRIRDMFKQIVLWLTIMVVGWAMVYYSNKLVEWFWRSAWADEHLWWTRQAIVLFWFLIVVVGGLILFWIVSLSNPANSIPGGF